MESQIVSSLLLLVHVAMATSASSQQENVHPIPYVDSAWDSEPSPPTSANGTAFRANLAELLGAFPSAAAPSGFAAMSRGAAGRDRLFVRCLCVDGGSPDDCFACLNAAAAESLGQLRHSPARRLLFRRVLPGLRRHQRLRVERGGPPRGDLSRRHRLVSDYGPAAPAPPTLEVPPTLGGEKETSSDAVPVREVALAVLPLAALLLVMVIVLIAVLIRIMRRTIRSRNAPSGNREGQECYVVPAHLTLQVLRAATSNFSEGNKLGLGEGPFGQVFKGKLRDGQEIVVKRLFIAYTELHEIQMEILSDALPNHSNLLQMLGYCLQEREALVLYEYMPNGSLDDLLSDPNRWRQQDWNARHAIIRGIAEGLVYLHGRPTGQRIILRNLMPRNILLDRDMNPKISDTAVVGPRDAAVVVPPYYWLHKPTEYFMTGVLTAKGNMFSFGVMVLEMVTGRRRVHSRPNDANSEPELLAYVREKWRTGSVADAVDAALGDGYPRNEVLNCVQIGLMCVEERPQSRPDASQVAAMLN